MREHLKPEFTARAAAKLAFMDALREADPHRMLQKKLGLVGNTMKVGRLSFDLSDYNRVLVIGGGKASAYMAEEVENMLNDWISDGAVNVPHYQKVPPLKHIVLHPARHPVPNAEGERGVKRMLEITSGVGQEDLVLCLISGGGSALMPLPVQGISLGEVQQVTELLLKSGATIQEMNCVRKHLSAVGGGRLAERLKPATVISLVVSDVVGNDLQSVASGPTVADGSTFADAKRILTKRSLWSRIPIRVRDFMLDGLLGVVPETPKPHSNTFSHVYNVLVGSNEDACYAATRRLRASGFKARVYSTVIQGEARKVGKTLAKEGRNLSIKARKRGRLAIVAGGETTVKVSGRGVGGRNQELVLAAAVGIDGLAGVTVASVGTDGVDGNTEAAGAIADWLTISRARGRKLEATDYLRRNDSYTFFERLGDNIITGPTGTNVNDIMIVLAEPA